MARLAKVQGFLPLAGLKSDMMQQKSGQLGHGRLGFWGNWWWLRGTDL